MIDSEFKVHFSRKQIPFVIASFLVIFGIMVATIFYKPLNKTLSIVFALIIAILGVFVTLMWTLFCVKVNRSEIAVRTRLGRRYQFNCSDIKEVIVSKRNSVKYGPSYYIIVLTDAKKLDLEWTMIGFEKMAGYLLEKAESGEIMKSAVSQHCKRELLRLSKKRGAYEET